jgi:hypothetical protein
MPAIFRWTASQGVTVSDPTIPFAACSSTSHQKTYVPAGKSSTVNTAERRDKTARERTRTSLRAGPIARLCSAGRTLGTFVRKKTAFPALTVSSSGKKRGGLDFPISTEIAPGGASFASAVV